MVTLRKPCVFELSQKPNLDLTMITYRQSEVVIPGKNKATFRKFGKIFRRRDFSDDISGVFAYEPLEDPYVQHYRSPQSVYAPTISARSIPDALKPISPDHSSIEQSLKQDWLPHEKYGEEYSDSDYALAPLQDVPLRVKPKLFSRLRKHLTLARPDYASAVVVREPDESSMSSYEKPSIEELPQDQNIRCSEVAPHADFVRSVARYTRVMAPLDSLADIYPKCQGVILIVESLAILLMLYELKVIIEGVMETVRAICLPLIVVGKLLASF